MALNGLTEEPARIERCAVGCNNNANFPLGDHCSASYRNTEKIRMNWPQPGWQRSQLNTFYAALLNKGNWILKIVVGVLSAIGREDASRKHWLAVDRLNDADFIGAYFNDADLAPTAFKRQLLQIQTKH